jgi:DNA repair protein RadC
MNTATHAFLPGSETSETDISKPIRFPGGEKSHAIYEYRIVRERMVMSVREVDSFLGEAASAPENVATLARAAGLHMEDQEHLVCLVLDTRNRIKAWHTVSVGLCDQAIAHPRECLRPAILHSGSSIILVHNHPSGDTTPSSHDFKVTTKIRDACQIVDIRFLDHVIVAEDGHYSMKENGSI